MDALELGDVEDAVHEAHDEDDLPASTRPKSVVLSVLFTLRRKLIFCCSNADLLRTPGGDVVDGGDEALAAAAVGTGGRSD